MPDILNENNVFYRHIGNYKSDETIVFVHGATMNGESMEFIASRINKIPRYNCIMVDLPAHGNSMGTPKKSVEELADFMTDFIEYLQEQGVASHNVTVAGYSLGGCIAIELAVRKISWLKRIIVLSSGADLKENAPALQSVRQFNEKTLDVAALFPLCFGQDSEEALKPILLDYLNTNKANAQVCYYDFIAAADYDNLKKASGIKIPVMIISGDEDQVIPVECGLKLKKVIRGASLAVLPYLGHCAIFERPEYTAQIISHFMEHNQK